VSSTSGVATLALKVISFSSGSMYISSVIFNSSVASSLESSESSLELPSPEAFEDHNSISDNI
jgi:hypothetical protein